MARYHAIVCDVLRAECLHYGERCGQEVSFAFLEQRLHNEPDRLRAELLGAIEAAPEGLDATLLFYGLCSNGVEGIRARDCPLVVPRAHDCITLFLGSRERYERYFTEKPGTYWFTAGWIDTGAMPSPERHAELIRKYAELYGEDNAAYLVEMTEGAWVRHYRRAAFVDLGIADTAPHRAYTRRCAEHFGWECEIVAGDPRLLQALLAGAWDPREFLVVPPGRKIIATHDARVVDWPR